MVITRTNSTGLQYQISNIGGEDTKPVTITLLATKTRPAKKLVVDHSLQAINQSWFFWMSGKKVQDAFPYLNADEREFLMTGITPDEWKKIFGESEDSDEDVSSETEADKK